MIVTCPACACGAGVAIAARTFRAPMRAMSIATPIAAVAATITAVTALATIVTC